MPDEQYLLRSPQPKWWRQASLDRCLSITAIVIALIAAYFSYLQYRADERQADIAEQARQDAKKASDAQAEDVELSRKAAEASAAAAAKLADGMLRSARAAEISADAGKTALSLNRRSLILSNIPSLQIMESRLQKPLTAGEVPTITTKLNNGGRGTAYRTIAEQWMRLDKTLTFPYSDPITLRSVKDLVPSLQTWNEMSNKLLVPLTSDWLKAIETGQLQLYVYGRATYYDRTLERERRYTLFWCQMYNADNDGSNKLLLGACPEHNYTTSE